MIIKHAVLNDIEELYGDLNNECGCYINNAWLSVFNITQIINNSSDNYEDILQELQEKYGDLNNDCGCYTNNNWLSISRIVEILENNRI